MAQSVDMKHLSQYIDHTLLRPDATEPEIARLCDEALEYGFMSVCVRQQWLTLVSKRLQGSSVLPITVISFPHGDDPTAQKCTEARKAMDLGAREIDMVLNRGLVKQKDYAALYEDIFKVIEVAGSIPVKVILETSELDEHEKVIACAIAKAAGACFVKTSTGFSKAGATESDIKLMRAVVGSEMGVKASGGIRTREDALRMLQAGASRLGTSASVKIVQP